MNQKQDYPRQPGLVSQALALPSPSGRPWDAATRWTLRYDADRGRPSSPHARRKLLVKTLDEALKMVSKDIDDGVFD